MKKLLAILMALSMIFGLATMSAAAASGGNVENGEVIPFSAWTSVGNGTWAQGDDGVIAPTDAQQWTMLSNNKDLGDTYTIEFDVMQADQNGSIKIGFEVETGHNFTQSGLVLEMHNAGVSRIYNWAINSTDESAYGGCNNGYGGGQGFSKTTDWIHVKIMRDKDNFKVTLNDGETRTFSFTSSDYNGGCLVLGSVDSRTISYKNISIVSTAEPTDWVSVGNGAWGRDTNGVYTPTDAQEWTMLSNNTDLGDVYTIEFDVKQPDQNDSIKIGFEVEPGHNFTQSGLVLEMHNAGVSRIYNWAINSADESAYGGCNNGYGGGQGFSKTTDWIHVKIVRNQNAYTVTFNDGEERTFSFTSSDYNGGCLVLGAVNGRTISYKNISIKQEVAQPDGGNTGDGGNAGTGSEDTDLPGGWVSVGDGAWNVGTDGVIAPTDAQEWTMLSNNTDLGDDYTIEFDVKQPDQSDSIKIGFEVEPGHNFTQSGLVLEMHNAGVSRIYNWAINSEDEAAYGGCNNGYGGNQSFSKTTDWIHVKITREKSEYTVIVDDGEARRFNFSTGDYDGGCLVLGAVNGRDITYKNVSVKQSVDNTEVIDSNNTYNGNGIPFGDWINAGNGSWKETEDSVIMPDEMGEWLLLRYNRDLGKHFRVELDVKQTDAQHSIMIGFAVDPGENFTQSGLVLDLHNAGISRVYDWTISAEDESAYGGCNNGYGGNGSFNCTTDWVHVVIEREGDHFVVQIDDGSSLKTFDFTAEGYDGGYLVLGANPSRQLQYKNITITKVISDNPSTGDAGIGAAVAVMLAAALGCGTLLLSRKKENGAF